MTRLQIMGVGWGGGAQENLEALDRGMPGRMAF